MTLITGAILASFWASIGLPSILKMHWTFWCILGGTLQNQQNRLNCESLSQRYRFFKLIKKHSELIGVGKEFFTEGEGSVPFTFLY
jgi:hypothetical protein